MPENETSGLSSSLRAKRSNPASFAAPRTKLDCVVASLLAMTMRGYGETIGRTKMKKTLTLTFTFLAGTALLVAIASPAAARDKEGSTSIASAARRTVTDVAGLKSPAEIL